MKIYDRQLKKAIEEKDYNALPVKLLYNNILGRTIVKTILVKKTISKLNGYYNFDYEVSKSYAMHGARPIIIPNVDEYYKYIDCAIGNGYTNTNNDIVTTTTYFYCLQGTREL